MFDIKSIDIPKEPGCYIMKNSDGDIIYIGKAKRLDRRVKSYFQKAHNGKTMMLVADINAIEFIITDSEIEALLLESKLIRKHKPKYNIDLKNSEKYAYIKITNEEYPRLITSRKVDLRSGEYFGPYTDGTSRRETIFLLNKIFKLRTCRKLPKKVCLLYHIGRCTAPCEKKVAKNVYLDQVAQARRVLKGEVQQVMADLKSEMQRFSKEQEYEKAKERRDQLVALNKIANAANQKVSLQKRYNQDYINYIQNEDGLYIQLFNVNKGIVSGRKEFSFDTLHGDIGDFIAQYYYDNDIPEEVVLPTALEDKDLIESYLSELKKGKVIITIPKKGKKKDLLALLKKNVKSQLSQHDQILLELKEHLNLQSMPRVIECFDISNIGKKYAVGSMVQFRDGRPDKSNYRRFKIRTVVGRQDDFAMMGEVVRRRYRRLTQTGEDLPDLIVIDGGKGQLGSAFSQLKDLDVHVPLISLAKKDEEIYFVGSEEPLRLSRDSKALQLIQQARDEAHRFGLKYHRLLRSKGMLS